LLIGQLFGLPASSAAFAFLVVRRHLANRTRSQFRSFIYSRSSANRANLARIGPVDVQIIGLTESLKNKYETKAEHKPAFGPGDLTRHWCIAGSTPGIPCMMD